MLNGSQSQKQNGNGKENALLHKIPRFQPVCSLLEVREEAALVAKECLMVYHEADLDRIWYVTLRPTGRTQAKVKMCGSTYVYKLTDYIATLI